MRMKRVRNSAGDYFFLPYDYKLKHSDIYGDSLYSNRSAFQDTREFKSQPPIFVQTEWHNDDGTMQIQREALCDTDIRGMLDITLGDEENISRDWWNNKNGDLIIRTFLYDTRTMTIAHCKCFLDNLDFSDNEPVNKETLKPTSAEALPHLQEAL